MLQRRRGLLRVGVAAVGADLRAAVARVCDDASAPALQVDLALGDPAAPWAVEALAADGFGYCALLPEYRDGDVLRLERIAGPVDDCRSRLATPEARALLDLIEADRRRAAGSG